MCAYVYWQTCCGRSGAPEGWLGAKVKIAKLRFIFKRLDKCDSLFNGRCGKCSIADLVSSCDLAILSYIYIVFYFLLLMAYLLNSADVFMYLLTSCQNEVNCKNNTFNDIKIFKNKN